MAHFEATADPQNQSVSRERLILRLILTMVQHLAIIGFGEPDEPPDILSFSSIPNFVFDIKVSFLVNLRFVLFFD